MFRKPGTILFIILVVSVAIRFYRIDYADGQSIFDERGNYLRATRTYLIGEDDTVPQHPPLGKELIALGILIFGDNPYGWRIPSLVFSLAGIVLIYLLAKEMYDGHSGGSNVANTDVMLERSDSISTATRKILSVAKSDFQDDGNIRRSFIPLVSAFLLSVDTMYFVYSRLAVMDMFLTVFVLLTLLFLWRVYKRGGAKNLVLLSFSFGFALATKWTALHLVPVILVFLFLRYRTTFRFLGVVTTAVAVVSAVYVTSYAPYLSHHSFMELVDLQWGMVSIWSNFDRDMMFTPATYFLRHAHSWILNPMTAYFADEVGHRKLRVIIGHFNPALFWGALGWGVWNIWENRTIMVTNMIKDRRALFLLLPILYNFVPWFFIRRTQYLYYALPSMPLIIILLVSALNRVRSTHRDRVMLFILVAIAIFLYDFPFLTGMPVSPRLLTPLAKSPLHVQVFDVDRIKDVFIPF